MFSNPSITTNSAPVTYPIGDSHLPFSDYLRLTRAIVEERRIDSHIDPNCPYELYPTQPIMAGKRLKHGVLLIHGLLDSPFTLRDIGTHLQTNGILCRSILLPGHGTIPSDLLTASYQQWIQAVRYGIDSLRQEVENIVLCGYSTGATLSVYHALQDADIRGVVLLSPAIKIKAPVDIAVIWHKLMSRMNHQHKDWLCIENEIDYVKYRSIPFHAINQVTQLIQAIYALREAKVLTTPLQMIVSREDETISSHRAIDFFSSQPNENSRLLLYTSIDHRYPDPRIQTRLSANEHLKIEHFSHVAIPFKSSNPHYGEKGDYPGASRPPQKHYIYGAYNYVESRFFSRLYRLGLVNNQRRELTFNPDFNFMADQITQFVLSPNTKST